MKLLLAEDDPILADALAENLRRAGFTVDWCADGGEAERQMLNGDYQVAILDLGLPTVDGLTVLKRVRLLKPALPILILTALCGLESRVEGLRAGADDYLTKPFDFPELEARLLALLRRSQLLPPEVQQFGRLRLDRAGQRAWCDATPIDLSARELALLDLLLAHREKVVTRERIATEFGSEAESGSNTVEVYVHRLRKKLEPCGVGIRTARGLGYLLELQAAP